MVYSMTQYLDSMQILFNFKTSQYAGKCHFNYILKKGMAFPGPQMFNINVRIHQTTSKSDDKCGKYA
jgi:hypothetical protein